ncbi:unnamed protein product [Closterium sp. NIES-65]|nr:unnamed protein product [Closterium sp. NIES-65]
MPQAPHPPSPTPAVRSPLHQRSAQHARLHPPRAPILPPLPLKLPGVRFLRFRHLRNPPRISTIPPCLLPPRAGRKIRGERSFWATRGEQGEVGETEKAEDQGERAGGTTTEGHGQVQGEQFLPEWRQWGAAVVYRPRVHAGDLKSVCLMLPLPATSASSSPLLCLSCPLLCLFLPPPPPLPPPSSASPCPLRLSLQPDLERIVRAAHAEGRRIRPVGSAISPNGIALSAHGMVNLALMGRVVCLDKSTGNRRAFRPAAKSAPPSSSLPSPCSLSQDLERIVQSAPSPPNGIALSAHSMVNLALMGRVDLERIVQAAHREGRPIRPVGSAISPNGIALRAHGMVNLALMDRVVHVDKSTGRVRVQAGARVEQVVEALRPYGLTLQNYASVREQQIGGFIQVGAHGTGAAIPPVDEQVLAIKLVTPGKGTLHLTPEADPDLFYLARCGLGALGVVGEVELQAIPAHRLREETFVTTKEEIKRHHGQWLRDSQHVRYMWIPHTQAVVVVRSNPVTNATSGRSAVQGKGPASEPAMGEDEKLAHVRALYLASVAARRSNKPSRPQSHPPSSSPSPASSSSPSHGQNSTTEAAAGMWSGTGSAEPAPSTQRFLTEAELQELSFTRLRDELLALDPLNLDHVRAINQAEALYWKLSEGEREGWSDQILGFDCGGQQWVSEVCFKAGGGSGTTTSSTAAASSSSNAADIAYMEELLTLIESEGIPAPAPIEQRWTSGSRSPMSPTAGACNAANAATAAAGSAASSAAGSAADGRALDDVYSWVGIIMYLPSNDPDQRAAITKHFLDYKFLTARRLWDKYGAHEHWAKIEIPADPATREWLVSRVARDFPVAKLNEYRRKLDPKNVLANDMLDVLFPR